MPLDFLFDDGRSFGDVGGHRVRLVHRPTDSLPLMLRAIEHATRDICLEMYWFDSDRTGQRFANALSEKARSGVRVRVVYDSAGSWFSDRAMFDRMREAGCEVLEFNPLAPWRRTFQWRRAPRRSHRKLLVIDHEVALTGGMNIADAWVARELGGAGWRDDAMWIQGPAVADMEAAFERAWWYAERKVWQRLEFVRYHPPQSSSVVHVIQQDAGSRRNVRASYIRTMQQARSHVLLTNSYFIPDGAVRRALYKARQRGAEVCVLIPAKSDVRAAQYAGQYMYQELLTRGVRIFEWSDSVLHAKSATMDDRWCTLGSYNLDYWSWRFNWELNVVVHDTRVAKAMREQFEDDRARAQEIHLAEWKQRSWVQQNLESLFYLFRKWL
jgi:cardiolipin synthase